MSNTVIMDKNAIQRTIIRLSHEVLERNKDAKDVALVGIRRGGEIVAERVARYIFSQSGQALPLAAIDIAPFRDDRKSAPPSAGETARLGQVVSGKRVVLCDDVLYTGRSVRAAIDGLFFAGRPREIQLLVLVDRGGREVPVRADFVGKNVAAAKSEHVQVDFEALGAAEDRLYLTAIG